MYAAFGFDQFRQRALALGLCLACVAPAWSAESAASNVPDKSVIGRKLDSFALDDFRGKQHTLADYADQKLLVIAFLGTECPLARLYTPRLNQLAAEFADRGVGFLAVDSNRQDSLAELTAFARDFDVKFPLAKDTGNVLADKLGAARTPQVFVLDTDRVVRYAGRIDDQYGINNGGSYQKPAPTKQELRDALELLLADKPVALAVTETDGCLIGRVRPVQEDAAVTYSNQIARIFNKNCVECHREGQIAPFPLTSYDEAVGWADMIDEVVREQRMPPWHANPHYGQFTNDARLSDDEKAQIAAWVRAGAPQGDPSQLPAPREFAGGWQMGREPDMVVYMADEPYSVPAEGIVQYQYFAVDPGFKEDKWVKIAECMPDNRGVVHHIIVFIQPPRGVANDARGFQFLVGYAPGTRPFECPEGMAKKIPAGSKLVFQMHYTPNGTPQKDRSSVGLCFVEDPSTIHHLVVTTNATNSSFVIPPRESAHEVKSQSKFLKDTTLLAMFPHMHLRGKSFRYELKKPDGTTDILLDVPRYDFNWQNHFILSQPMIMPAGSEMHCTAYFDNSEENLANPDPNSEVRWGDQTFEEMMIGWFDIAVPVGEDPATYAERRRGRRGSDDGE